MPYICAFNGLFKFMQQTNKCNKTKLKLRDLSPHANYTDRATAAGRRS